MSFKRWMDNAFWEDDKKEYIIYNPKYYIPI